MTAIHLQSAIDYLLAKYEIARVIDMQEVDPGKGMVVVTSRGAFQFFSDFTQEAPLRDETAPASADLPDDPLLRTTIQVPLFTWRSERRYQEMRNVLRDDLVGKAVGMRIKHIAPEPAELQDLLVREIDLAQWILGKRVEQVFAAMNGDTYCNAVLSMGDGTKLSAEIGVSKTKESIVLHEIVATRGTIADVAVDTQVVHYPVYVYSSNGTASYNDVDFELYGLDYARIALVRFIVETVARSEAVAELQDAYRHVLAVIDRARESAILTKNLAV